MHLLKLQADCWNFGFVSKMRQDWGWLELPDYSVVWAIWLGFGYDPFSWEEI